MFEFLSLKTQGRSPTYDATPALMSLDARITPAVMADKFMPLAQVVNCNTLTPVTYSWVNHAGPFIPILTSPGYNGTFTAAAVTRAGLFVQEAIPLGNGLSVFVVPYAGPMDLFVFTTTGHPVDNGPVPLLSLSGFTTFHVNCPPTAEYAAPAIQLPPPAPVPPPYVPPATVELSISSVFVDAQPGVGLEEIGRFTVGSEAAVLQTIEVRDEEGGFAGALGSTIELRYFDPVNGAYGPVLGNGTVVDDFTIRVTDINAAVTPQNGDSQLFTLGVNLSQPVLLETARGYGTLS